MIKLPVQKHTFTEQHKHTEHQDATDILEKLFCFLCVKVLVGQKNKNSQVRSCYHVFIKTLAFEEIHKTEDK